MLDKLRRLRADHLLIQHGLTFYPYQEEISDQILIALLDNLRITAGATEEDVKKLKQVEIAIELSRQCIAEGSFVSLSNGDVKAIEDIILGDEVVCYEGLMQRKSFVKNVWETGEKECFEIRTRKGKKLVVSKDHKLLTPDGFLSIADGLTIQKEARINCHKSGSRGMVAVSNSAEYGHISDPNLAKILGYFADGYTNSRQTPKFTNTNVQYIDEFEQLVKDRFGVSTNRRVKGNGFDLHITNGSHVKGSNQFINWLRQVGLYNKTKPEREMPSVVFNFDRESLGIFLNRFIASDGWVSNGDHSEIGFSGVSEKHAKQIVGLLSKVGITSYCGISNGIKSTKDYWKIRVADRASLKNLVELTGPIFGKEQEYWRVYGYIDSAKRAVGRFEQDIYWDHIQEIKPVGIRQTYDLEVDQYHNYVANELVVHNSGKTYAIGHTGEFILTFLPKLFNRPIRIGIFAAQIDQAKISYGIMRNALRKSKATLYEISAEEEQFIKEEENAKKLVMPDGSSAAIAPINLVSQIEGLTLDLIIIDEAQVAKDKIVKHSIWPMGKVCVCAGTKIYSDDGRIVDVKDVKDGDKIIGFDEKEKKVVTNQARSFGSGLKLCVRLTTNSGRTIECSIDHPILTKPRSARNIRWAEAQDITIGTQIAIADAVDRFGTSTISDPRLIGMLIGDGSYRNGGMVRFCSNDMELLNYVRDSYEFKVYGSHECKDDKTYEEGTIRGLIPELRNLGIYGQTGKGKRLPKGWDSYNKKTLSLLLAGLFDTDGNIHVEENRRVRIQLSSCTRLLLEEVSDALEKFGIHSRIRCDYDETRYREINGRKFKSDILWTLIVAERKSIILFAENVDLLINRKSKMLQHGVEVLMEHKNKRQKNMSNMYFERLISIEDIGQREVFNMTAEGTNTYLANGIITHNTNSPRVYIGKAGTSINHFYRLSQRNETFKAYFDTVATQRRETYRKTGDPIHLIYEQSVREDIEKQGIDADEIQREYFGKWQIGTGQFVTQEDLMALEDQDRSVTHHFKKGECFAGIDTGKHPDSTVCSIIRDCGETVERTLPDGTKDYGRKKELLNWMELRGENYQNQFDILRDFLSRYNIVALAIDSTGQGDFMPDMFENNTEWQDENSGLYRIKFSATSKDIMYKNLKVSIQQKLLRLPSLNTKIAERFKEQMLDLQQEHKGQLLSVHHPDSPGAKDDFADSLALADFCHAKYYADHEPQLFIVSTAKERKVVKDDEEETDFYWPGLQD